jgi:hypothetical protein
MWRLPQKSIFSPASETEAVRQQARRNLEKENDALSAKLRQMRGQQ